MVAIVLEFYEFHLLCATQAFHDIESLGGG